jgi:hypothetical protein
MKTDGKRSIERFCRGWKDDIDMDLEETVCKIMTQSHPVVETIQWYELVNKVMIPRFTFKARSFLKSCRTVGLVNTLSCTSEVQLGQLIAFLLR